MKFVAVAILCLTTVVFAAVVEDDAVDTSGDTDGDDERAAAEAFVQDLIDLGNSAYDLMDQVETTLETVNSLMTSHVQKRQTDIGGSISRDRSGTTYSGNVGHTFNNGRSRIGGSVNHHSRGGTSYGVSFSHRFG